MLGAAVGELVCVPGGILAGLISDYTNGRATTCCVMLILAAPMVCITSGQSACAYAHLGTYAHVCLCVCVYIAVCSSGRRGQGPHRKETRTESFRKGLVTIWSPVDKLLAQGKNKSLGKGKE